MEGGEKICEKIGGIHGFKMHVAIWKNIFLIQTAERAWDFYISRWDMTQKLRNTAMNLRYLLIDINRNNYRSPLISILIFCAGYLITGLKPF